MYDVTGIVLIYVVLILWVSAASLIVDRSEESLRAFPTDISTRVTILILDKNNTTRIDDNSVASLIDLEKLKLDFNGVEFISANAFINNIHLLELHIQGHCLSPIPRELSGARKTLVTLHCGRAEHYIPAVHMTNYTVLTKLVMSLWHTNSLVLGKQPTLKKIIAQNCQLQEFPDFSGAPQLEEVQLHWNNFTSVPHLALARLSLLKKLSFPGCPVMHLPDLSHLKSLVLFCVSANALPSIPDMFNLSITKFNIADNPLVCDKALCWLRMWDYFNVPIDAEISQKGTCAEPTEMRGLLMDAHSVGMKCYEGKPE